MARTAEKRIVKKKVPLVEHFFSSRIIGSNDHQQHVSFMNDRAGAAREVHKTPPAEDPNAQIAAKLRALYLSVQEEAIPDKFLDLLEKLDAVERQTLPSVAE